VPIFGTRGVGIATSLALIVTACSCCAARAFRSSCESAQGNCGFDARGSTVLADEAGYELLRRVDVFVIALFLGPTAVGFYGISILVMDFAWCWDRRAYRRCSRRT